MKEAFTGVDYALLVGAMPRREGMERADLLKANAAIFKTQGKALNDYSSRNVKVPPLFFLIASNCICVGGSSWKPCQHQRLVGHDLCS